MKNRKLIPIAVMALVILDFIGYYFSIKSVVMVSIISILVITAITTIENIIIICFICVPFFYLITIKLGQFSYVYLIIIIYFIKFIMEKIKENNLNQLINKYFISLLIFICTIRNLFSLENKRYISWLILTVYFIFVYNDKHFKLKKCINWYTISFVISSVLGYIVIKHGRVDILPVDLGVVFNKWNITYRFVGLIGETNGYAQVNLILLIVNIISMIYCKNIRDVMKKLIISGLLIVFGVMTYSKMYLIGICIFFTLVILYGLYRSVKKKINVIRLFFIILSCIIISILIGKFIIDNAHSSLITNYLIRFKSKDLSTGRLEVFKYFIKLLNNNIFYWYFGAGFYRYLIPWRVTGTNGICAHNIYLECTVLFGIIGLCIFLGLLAYRVIYFLRKKRSFLSFTPLIMFMITGISLHSMLTNYFYFLLLLIMGILEKNIFLDA
ncbi:MAG: hypothetical protein E7207_04765 [Clostridium butyricum]|nr:hypothetical protein [Clostridium butyricum]